MVQKIKYEHTLTTKAAKKLLSQQKGFKETYSDVVIRMCGCKLKVEKMFLEAPLPTLIQIAKVFGWTKGNASRSDIVEFLGSAFLTNNKENSCFLILQYI